MTMSRNVRWSYCISQLPRSLNNKPVPASGNAIHRSAQNMFILPQQSPRIKRHTTRTFKDINRHSNKQDGSVRWEQWCNEKLVTFTDKGKDKMSTLYMVVLNKNIVPSKIKSIPSTYIRYPQCMCRVYPILISLFFFLLMKMVRKIVRKFGILNLKYHTGNGMLWTPQCQYRHT